MLEMIDRVATVLLNFDRKMEGKKKRDWEKVDIHTKSHYRYRAAIAIGAMREPTKAIESAFMAHTVHGDPVSPFGEMWAAMIDAALKEGTDG